MNKENSYNKEKKILKVKVIKGNNLKARDADKLSDPYIILRVGFNAPKKNQQKTKVISNSLNPIWNETFEFKDVNPEEDHLYGKVYDKDRLVDSKVVDDKLGMFKIPLSILSCGKTTPFDINLMKVDTGSIHLELTAENFGIEEKEDEENKEEDEPMNFACFRIEEVKFTDTNTSFLSLPLFFGFEISKQENQLDDKPVYGEENDIEDKEPEERDNSKMIKTSSFKKGNWNDKKIQLVSFKTGKEIIKIRLFEKGFGFGLLKAKDKLIGVSHIYLQSLPKNKFIKRQLTFWTPKISDLKRNLLCKTKLSVCVYQATNLSSKCSK